MVRDSILKLQVPILSSDSRGLYTGIVDMIFAGCFQNIIIKPLVVDDPKVMPVAKFVKNF